jgi:hypothetical protein
VAERGLLYVREPPGDFRRALGLGFRKNIFFRENPQKEGHLDGLINTIVPSSHYFLRFSAEYKKIFGEDSLEGKDWYEFVEFGSTNRLSIFLQRNGYSRDSAIYLMRHRQKYIITDGQGFKISNLVFQSENEGIVSESKDIIYNIKSLFN